jgi:methionine-rich copper-binding protein CopC
MRIAKALFATIAATAMLAASPAFAHARLVSSTPAANATVQTGPRTITLVFNERVVPAFSKIELTMPEHGMNVPVNSTVSEDGKRIIGTLQSPLHKGSYAVHWTAAGSDGHKMEGHINFRVG